MCDVSVFCETTINLYPRCPVIKNYATPNHDVCCRNVLTLGKMGQFVAFSVYPPYTPTNAIPPQTVSRFICEQLPMSFNDPGTLMMTPHQTFND
ncbi:hypothetical protein TNCV_4464001 [Trichonephila clavipes]|nr:hypothetical protein TNCV_4464001 [Trichonephila clavipes]